MARYVIGTFAGYDTVVIPTAIFDMANATLDAAAEQAASADASRLKSTRRARAMRRFKKALTLLRGGIR
jgi:hypothetical protein